MRNNKGFTLAELLIVVAIIAVLVSIAVPMFWIQLEKSREKNDVNNARSAYSEVRTCAITGSTEGFDVSFDGVNYTKSFRMEQTRAGWSITDDDHRIKGLAENGEPEPNTKCVVSCNKEGEGRVYWNGIPNSYSTNTSWTYKNVGQLAVGQNLIQNNANTAWNQRVTSVDRPLDATIGSTLYVKAPDEEELKKYNFGFYYVKPSTSGDKEIIFASWEASFNTSKTLDYSVKHDLGSDYTGDVEIYIQLISPEGTPAPDEKTSKKLLDLFYVEGKKVI